MMSNSIFWSNIQHIIDDDFSYNGLIKLKQYAEQFISQQLVYERFSSFEQYGCAAGGVANVIATLLTGANAESDPNDSFTSDFKRECQLGASQEQTIEQWAKKTHLWIENVDFALTKTLGEYLAEGGEARVYQQGTNLIKSIGLDYYIQPILALDRISLHNTYFPETKLIVVGFGRTSDGRFQIIAQQPFIQGTKMSDNEIHDFAVKIGFTCISPKNWTYATPQIYLSDLHDENVIRSKEGNVFVVDCDIRLNTPKLRCGGTRFLTTEVNSIKN